MIILIDIWIIYLAFTILLNLTRFIRLVYLNIDNAFLR